MEIRKYEKGDEREILELFKIVFKQEMTKEFWNWRFLSNPFTNDKFIYLMWDNKKLVGHYAVSPVEMNFNGEKINTALSMTTMTHPEYGGKGIFSQLAAELNGDIEKNGYKMIWGFPNNNSHYGFIKNLGWRDIAVLPMMSLKLSETRMITNDGVDYRLIENFDDALSDILNHSDEKLSINKTRKYLQWRYVDNPDTDYKIIQLENENGFVVFKRIKSFQEKGMKEIDIMEISFNGDINNLTELLNSILNYESGNLIVQFNIWIPLFSKERLSFERLGFKNTLPITYLSFLGLSEIPEIKNFENWEIGLGYSDVF